MAINLNDSLYGAQFKAFVDFAAGQRDQGTIVRLEGEEQGMPMPGPNGEPRVIIAKHGDGYGHIWRNADSKAINTSVRNLFMSSILAVCGVDRSEQLPANVRAVLKEDDYRWGRPLTARRITAVKRAIDVNFQAAAANAQAGIERQLAQKMSGVPQETRHQKAQQLVELAKGDVSLLQLFADSRYEAVAYNILGENNHEFSDVADIEQRVEGFRRNLNELRRVTNGDRAQFEQILGHLSHIGNLPLQDGQIERMVTAIWNLDLAQVRSCLNRDANVYDAHFEAFLRLQKMVNSVVAEVGFPADENVERAQFDLHDKYKFIYAVICDNFNAGERRRLLDDLNHPRFGDDCRALHDIATGKWDQGGDEEPLKTNIRNFAHTLVHGGARVVRNILRDSLGGRGAMQEINLAIDANPWELQPMYEKIKNFMLGADNNPVVEGDGGEQQGGDLNPGIEDNGGEQQAGDDNPGVGDNVGDVPEVIGNPVVDEVPVEDVDDDAVVIEQHEPPAFIDGLEPETKDYFMDSFYDEAVSRTVAGGRTKEDCDATIKAMFDTIGDDADDRKFLAELLANGKPAFLAERGRLPSKDDAVAFAQGVKALLEQAKLCRANFPERYGSVVADTILATLKTMERMVRADELEPIDAELCAKLYDAAAEVDTSDILTLPGRGRPLIKAMGEKLENFRRQVDEKFEAAFPGGNGSPFMRTLKKNIYMNLALLNVVPKAYPLFKVIDEYGPRLRNGDAMENLLDVILPVLKRSTIGRRLIDM